ncbi:DUF1885 family protein [Brockia lithotrophica]|uniref:Uncharacterized protein DUF1885 n=1 Tax=Brockia lithotrophica TaxID=933949 RepID=A0A660KUR6_9BACL|nr:DUF1885 family protein [Brockia lithotrophica]RKQ83655.1 uncharacterized protein DUF1885 [Brockia lithotrophica]
MRRSTFVVWPKGEGEGISLEALRAALEEYRGRLEKTGEQLDAPYASWAFPYEIEERERHGIRYLYLRGKGVTPQEYTGLLLTAGSADGQNVVQITVVRGATDGDFAKANELARYLARRWKAEIVLFTGKVKRQYAHAKR